MMNSIRPPTAPQTQRRMSANPFAAVLQDDDENAPTTQIMESFKPSILRNVTTTVNNNNNSNDTGKNDVDDDDNQTSQSFSTNRHDRPPLPSAAVATSKKSTTTLEQQQQRRRRRSSARFLQLSKISAPDDDDEDDDEIGQALSSQKDGGTLQEMYQTAIRMNAENKINTTNSWNLHIIDQMDTLLSLNDDDDDLIQRPNPNATSNTLGVDVGISNTLTTKTPRINFTKASCTLDASVKIYSYRVDDVHLTSYKVLANLNRTQNNNTHKNDKATDHNLNENDDEDNENKKSQRKESSKASSGTTIESNIANINLNKLDSAYDIDPLFHKMSKNFDEGGAKGLLLANLGVSESGCRIVFDSTASDGTSDKKNSNGDPAINSEETIHQGKLHRIAEGMMDISSLTEKLKVLLSEHCNDDDDWDLNTANDNISNVRSIPLVPQLSALRTEHEKLVELGCCGPDAATALASTIGPKTPAGKVRKYHANSKQEHDADYSIHKEAIERSHRKLNFTVDDDDDNMNVNSTGNALFRNDNDDSSMNDGFGGTFGYDDGVDDNDDDHCFDAFIANARYSEVSLTSPSGQPSTMASTSNTMLQQPSTVVADFIDAISSGATVLSTSDYEYFSSKNKNVGKSKKKRTGDARWRPSNSKNKASKKKASTRGKKIKETDVSLVDLNPSKKMVEFNLPSSDWGDDDDGPGFNFGGDANDDDDDEFIVPMLENVRKVDKVRVGYATVAKKVDVKRLKRDLWSELESHFTIGADDKENNVDSSNDVIENVCENEIAMPSSTTETDVSGSKSSIPAVVSFQETVRILGQEQSQSDITLPFYFICILHLANEKGLRLEQGCCDVVASSDIDDGKTETKQRLLSDFTIYRDELGHLHRSL